MCSAGLAWCGAAGATSGPVCRHWGAGLLGENRIWGSGAEATGAGGLWPRSAEEEGSEGGLSRSAWLSDVALAEANSEPLGMRSGPPSGGVRGQSSSLVLLRARPAGGDCLRARMSRGGTLTGHGRAFQWAQQKKVLLLPTAQDRS